MLLVGRGGGGFSCLCDNNMLIYDYIYNQYILWMKYVLELEFRTFERKSFLANDGVDLGGEFQARKFWKHVFEIVVYFWVGSWGPRPLGGTVAATPIFRQ